jgi:hypothetical protein
MVAVRAVHKLGLAPAPMTLGNVAAASVRLMVWCLDYRHQTELDPAEMAERFRHQGPCGSAHGVARGTSMGWSAEPSRDWKTSDCVRRFTNADLIPVLEIRPDQTNTRMANGNRRDVPGSG